MGRESDIYGSLNMDCVIVEISGNDVTSSMPGWLFRVMRKNTPENINMDPRM